MVCSPASGATILADASSFSSTATVTNFSEVCCTITSDVSVAGVTISAVGGDGDIRILRLKSEVRVGDQEQTALVHTLNDEDFSASDLLFVFDQPVNKIGFEMVTQDNLDLTLSTNDNNVVEAFTLTRNAGGEEFVFYGFETVNPFDRLLIEIQDIHHGEWYFDNLRYETVGAVPLPAALPLFLSGLAGLGLMGWRSRRHKREPLR